jgi:predicted Zn-dependent protease
VLLLAVAASAHAAKQREWTPEQEEKVGAPAAKGLEEAYGLVDDREQLARLQHMVRTLAAVSERPDAKYTVKILNFDAPNAVAIPGGYLYFTRGLVESVDSDDELAAVVAHEMAHNCLFHAMGQLGRAKKLQKASLWTALAALLLGGPDAAVNMVIASRYVATGILNHYTVEIEAEADAHAVQYMYKSPYNPVGLLTFLERLARATHEDVMRDPRIREWGIYQTHPSSHWRAEQIMDKLLKLGVNVSREVVTKWARARALPAYVAGRPGAEVELFEECVFAPASVSPAGEDPLRRAALAAEKLNAIVAGGLMQYEVSVVDQGDRFAVLARDRTVFRVYPEDAEAHGKSMRDLASEFADSIKLAITVQETRHRY